VLTDAGRLATATERQPERWAERVEAEGHGIAERTMLGASEQMDEALIMGLRLSEGLDLDRLQRIGSMRPRPAEIARLVALGLIEADGHRRLRATPRGRIVLNEVVLRLASALEPAATGVN